MIGGIVQWHQDSQFSDGAVLKFVPENSFGQQKATLNFHTIEQMVNVEVARFRMITARVLIG